jgi:SAM-dependent methyltransferase
MTRSEIEQAIRRYNERLEKYGISELALGWGEKGRAKLRYEILTSCWDFNNTSILDFGCGFGDMYQYIFEKGIRDFKYTGIDINQMFIDIAIEKYGKNAEFLVKNLLEDEIKDKFDFVLSSGVFNFKLENNIKFIEDSFEKFNELSIKGFAVNFLSNKVEYQYDYTYHANPSTILDIAYKYSKNVILRNDYMPYEFTIFVNKYSQIDSTYTVYKEYVKYV